MVRSLQLSILASEVYSLVAIKDNLPIFYSDCHLSQIDILNTSVSDLKVKLPQNGRSGRTRTDDSSIKSRVLYPSKLQTHLCKNNNEEWRLDSN